MPLFCDKEADGDNKAMRATICRELGSECGISEGRCSIELFAVKVDVACKRMQLSEGRSWIRSFLFIKSASVNKAVRRENEAGCSIGKKETYKLSKSFILPCLYDVFNHCIKESGFSVAVYYGRAPFKLDSNHRAIRIS